MDSGVSVAMRDFDASIEEAYRSLFPGDPDKSQELLDWRVRRNPHGPTLFAVATQGDTVVGMIALIPTRLTNAPGSGLAYEAVDTAVHPSCRGKGLFVKMGALAQDPSALGGQILWGFPNANAAPGWFGRLGWSNFGQVPLLIRPLRARFLLGRLHRSLTAVDFPLVRKDSAATKVYEEGAELARDFDSVWEKVAKDYGVAVDRNGEWMRWRLLERPGADYRCVGIKARGELDAFVATRIADKHGSRIAYCMEAIAAPEKAPELAKLLRAELALAAGQGAEVALAWCPKSAPNYAAYRKAGFLPFPPRFRPIEINFGARALVPEAAAAASSGSAWYLSFLDSDTN